MRVAATALAASLVACAGAPPPGPSTKPSTVAVSANKPAPEPAPEPVLLPSERVELTQKSDFLQLDLGNVSPKLMTKDDLVARLPAAVKAELRVVERADQAVTAAFADVGTASSNLALCDDCAQQKALEAAQQRAYDKHDRALEARTKARTKAEASLEKMLARPAAPPALGLALSRLQNEGTLDPPSSKYATYGEVAGASYASDALVRAVELSPASDELGQAARRELLHLGADEEREQKIVDELLASGPAEWRAELHFRSALRRAAGGDDRGALERFERALKDHTRPSAVTRPTIRLGILVARYRMLDFEGTLAAASALFEEWATPPVPDSSSAGRSIYGLLSLTTAGLGEAEVARFAADAVERLDRDPTALEGRSDLRIAILSRLAVRALYRGDAAAARRWAEAALLPEPTAEAEDAYRVLELLARREGDEPRASELAKKRSALRVAMGRLLLGSTSFDEPDRAALVAELRELTQPEADAKSTAKKDEPEPPAERAVRSAMRLCVEPVRGRLPKAAKGTKRQTIANVTLEAKVFDDGHAVVETSADSMEDGMASVVECLKSTAPRVLARAPSSVSAKVAIDDAARRSGGLASIFGLGSLSATESVWGELSGAGGLGLVGTGSGGGGTGVGTIGLGRIGGLGTKGHGSGGLAGKKKKAGKKPPAPKKAPSK